MKWSCKICNNSRLVIITSFPKKSQKNPKESKKIPNLYYNKWMLNIYRHGRREDALALQWGTCCWCSRWACRSFPRRRPPLWRTWWTGRRWTPWPRPEVEEGNQQGDEGNERNREAHMLTLFWCLVLLWLLAEDEKGRERDREGHMLTLSSRLLESLWPFSPLQFCLRGRVSSVLTLFYLAVLSAASDNGLLRSGSSPVSSSSVGYAICWDWELHEFI